MENLPLSIRSEFEDHGHWVVCKMENRFSAMPIDQAHEQNNSVIKGSGGAIGLTENPSAFRKWVITGPEQAQLIVVRSSTCEKFRINTCIMNRALQHRRPLNGKC